jgi:uncharacterized membrane protein YfcA
MTLVLLLSVAIGLALGLFGGGGSILTVPILVYAAGLEAKPAIATSLLVVGVTAAVALVPHARAGHVHWRTGLVFGAAGMAGAAAGGWLGRFVAGPVLLLLFAAMMAATAWAMWRGRPEPPPGAPAREHATVWIVLEGLGVGLVTGLVGAGGGFLVVPALALLGGLPMAAAVGTSLLVIALKSGAGFLGYATHVSVDAGLALAVTAAAVAGSFGGARLAAVLHPDRLRRGFALFVLVMAAFVVAREAPPLAAGLDIRGGPMLDSPVLILNDAGAWAWPWAGMALGAVVLLMLGLSARRLGISSSFEDLCGLALRTPYFRRAARDDGRRWRLPFVGGLVLGGVLAAATSGGWSPVWDLGRFDASFGWGPAGKLAWMFAGGVALGFGARLAGGCTSGHGVFGVSNLERSGMVATASFLAAGIATAHVIRAVGG